MLRSLFCTVLVTAFLGAVPALNAQQPPDEEIVVTANAYPVPFENLSRSVDVFSREDIQALPVHSIADVLAMASSVDLRSRSPFGVQSDISIRGAAFSQTLVLVDGVRINDSQTGHHNSDFPVQLQDVERIEVLLGPGSSIYGADAFGGSVNIITRRDAKGIRGSFSGGQYGFVEGAFSAGFRKGILEQSISVTGNRSSGFQYDRDFRNIVASARTNIGSRSTFFISHADKEFGANNFYGPAPSREWTDQTLVSFEHRYTGRSGLKAQVQGYYRTHGDQFLYDMRSPDLFKSSHRTHSAGAVAKSQYPVTDTALLTVGGELGGDWIDSNNLGDHSYSRTSLFTELQWSFGKTAAIFPGLRFDYYSNFGAAASPSLSGSWWIVPRLRLRSSVGHAFRIPTFTELYYHDPNNQASAFLEPETAWSFELGTDFVPARNWMASLTLFARRERNVIDWIRSSPAEKWRTANIRKLQTRGVEIGMERYFGASAGLSARYTRISSDPGPVDYISKYALDYARDSWTASTFFPLPFRLVFRQTLNYKKRADGRSYWLLDGGLERRFRRLTAQLGFSNLLDSQYQEIKGVDMPGRWFIFTLRTR
jgi:outer membrane cobalamin receptor